MLWNIWIRNEIFWSRLSYAVNIGPKQICALDPNNKIDACQVNTMQGELWNIKWMQIISLTHSIQMICRYAVLLRENVLTLMEHATVQDLYQRSSDFENNISTQGDSGGPLVVLKRDTNEERRCKFTWSLWPRTNMFGFHWRKSSSCMFLDRYFLVGVVSYGYKCAEPVRFLRSLDLLARLLKDALNPADHHLCK